MYTKRATLALVTMVVALAAGLVFSGCGKKQGSKPVAKVGSAVITEEDMEARTKELPPFVQQQFNGPEGKKRLLDAMVDEELVYQDARAMGLEKSEAYLKELERSKRDILMRTYYDKVMEAKATPSDKEVEDYYNTHKDEFVVPENVTARHILVKTGEEAVKIRRQLVGGAKFADLAAKYSLDANSKANGGLIGGTIQKSGNVRGLGLLPEFGQAAFDLKEGEVSQPVKTSKGYHLIMVEKRAAATSRTLDEAKADITSRLANSKRKNVRDEVMGQLRSKYKVVVLGEASNEPKTPEDLFKMASEASSPQEKIKYYDQFTKRYPTNERAYEAKFMIGFTMAEDLKDYDGAEKVFKDFLEKYPASDLSDDAKWMLENMRSGKHPDITGD
jgi:peptidyl-prolyl cis-trans isomerase C